MAAVLRELARVARSRLSVLLSGPSGCGKELAARELHRLSGRSGPLVPVNCSAFAESLLESELFGHVKGAYTGALRDRRGAVECAEGGTLFLDEVADLAPRLQALLLRVLQEREVRRLGAERALQVDVRFLAATHRPLDALAEAGAFRHDLLYRLQGAVLALPALCERRHEFPFLVPRLVARVSRENGQAAPALRPGLSQALARLPWPGNFRELLHAIERALLRCGPGPLEAGPLPGTGRAARGRRHLGRGHARIPAPAAAGDPRAAPVPGGGNGAGPGPGPAGPVRRGPSAGAGPGAGKGPDQSRPARTWRASSARIKARALTVIRRMPAGFQASGLNGQRAWGALGLTSRLPVRACTRAFWATARA